MNKLETSPINHIAFVLDESGSMEDLADTVVRVFDDQIKTLAKRSVELNQETRVSLYTFSGSEVRCVVYDKDVLRLPSLKGHYRPGHNTPLITATVKALEDLLLQPELYADHAFLVYVITDGIENASDVPSFGKLPLLFNRTRAKKNWTVGALVPDRHGLQRCVGFGFDHGNVMVWDATTRKGLEDVGVAMTAATESYMTLRSQGVRSTTSLFTAQVTAKRQDVTKVLKPVTNPYTVYTLPTTATREAIKDFVERRSRKDYVVGSAFYQLVKTETIQANKRICLRTVPDGRLFSGNLDEVRGVLGLPAGGDIKVAPGEIKDFVVFIESTSVNRNIIPGQEVLVMKL
jgi:hypothetical protein